MNLAELTVDQDEAITRLREYESQLADERTAEDQAILLAYRHAARGLPIIRLSEAFRIAGRHPGVRGDEERGLPRLAIARATAQDCVVSHDGGDLVFHGVARGESHWNARNRGAALNKSTVRIFDAAVGAEYCRPARTIVPPIPPRHRPTKRRLAGFHVLWEVDTWTPEPPVDPALIRHIRGDLWSVVAVWDLTDIERAVLAQRSR